MANILEGSKNYVKEDNHGGYNSKNDTLTRKLQLEPDALMVLSQELDQCRAQRDQFKLMAEQIQERFLHLKKQISKAKELNGIKLTLAAACLDFKTRRNLETFFYVMRHIRFKECNEMVNEIDRSIIQVSYNLDDDYRTLELLTEAREQNKCLRVQVETLRQKLGDAQGDIRVLRKTNRTSADQQETQLAPAVHQREEMIEQLEKLNVKCAQLQTDLQTLLDEKHELEIERDAFKCKAHRLNHELSKALGASKPVDLDALINENRYLQERLQQSLEEKELARQSLSKYKSMLDSKRMKGTIKLGGNSAAGTVMTHKQVEQLLQQGTQIPPQASAAAMTDLRCLCTALLEALNDKTLALAHQKKANKILALRICELDSTVQSPTTQLLEGYAGADVDIRSAEEYEGSTEYNHPTEPVSENVKEAANCLQRNRGGTTALLTHKFNQVQARHLNSKQIELPENLDALVQKALNNLKENDRNNL